MFYNVTQCTWNPDGSTCFLEDCPAAAVGVVATSSAIKFSCVRLEMSSPPPTLLYPAEGSIKHLSCATRHNLDITPPPPPPLAFPGLSPPPSLLLFARPFPSSSQHNRSTTPISCKFPEVRRKLFFTDIPTIFS